MTKAQLERAITDLWRSQLGLASVEPHQNFFELGGNSVAMIRVHAGLQEALATTIPIMELFRNPTVHSLADWLHAQRGEAMASQLMLATPLSSPLRSAPALSVVDGFESRAAKQRAAHARLREDRERNDEGV